MIHFHVKFIGLLTLLLSAQGCGTIVGNGNKCDERSCGGDAQEPVASNSQPDEKSEAGEDQSNTKTPVQTESDMEPGSSRSTSTNSQDPAPNAQYFVAAIFDPCSAIFELNLATDLVLKSSEALQEQMISIRMTTRPSISGIAKFQYIDRVSEEKYQRAEPAVCANRSITYSSLSSHQKVQSNQFVDANGRSVIIEATYREVTLSPNILESITVIIGSSRLNLLVD